METDVSSILSRLQNIISLKKQTNKKHKTKQKKQMIAAPPPHT